MHNASFQPGLFDARAPAFDPSFASLTRVQLDETAWVDCAPGWVSGGDALFEELVRTRDWKQRKRLIHGKRMDEPRLTSPWNAQSGEPLPPLVGALLEALRERYGVAFDSVGFNYYRDGRDSVAWHGDHIRREIREPVVALVSLGAPRKLLLRPRGGGASRPFPMASGDLLVTGGRTQRTWEHALPKVAHAGPRISLAFRHGLDSRAYEP